MTLLRFVQDLENFYNCKLSSLGRVISILNQNDHFILQRGTLYFKIISLQDWLWWIGWGWGERKRAAARNKRLLSKFLLGQASHAFPPPISKRKKDDSSLPFSSSRYRQFDSLNDAMPSILMFIIKLGVNAIFHSSNFLSTFYHTI